MLLATWTTNLSVILSHMGRNKKNKDVYQTYQYNKNSQYINLYWIILISKILSFPYKNVRTWQETTHWYKYRIVDLVIKNKYNLHLEILKSSSNCSHVMRRTVQYVQVINVVNKFMVCVLEWQTCWCSGVSEHIEGQRVARKLDVLGWRKMSSFKVRKSCVIHHLQHFSI